MTTKLTFTPEGLAALTKYLRKIEDPVQASVDANYLIGRRDHAAVALRVATTTHRDRVRRGNSLGYKPTAASRALRTALEKAQSGTEEKTGETATEAAEAAPVVQDINLHPVVIGLRDETARLRARVREVERDNLEAEEIRKAIFGLAAQRQEPPTWMANTGRTSGVTGCPQTIWSDWHVGETVYPNQVNGINEYNLDIFDARLRRLVDRTIDLCFLHMTNPVYPGIVVNILGDIVSGDIHAELKETNELELYPIILHVVSRMTWALRVLADKFGRVFVPCVAGNHGRKTKREEAKNNYAKNADWLIYQMVERELSADKRVQFLTPDTGEVRYDVYGTRYMGVHGHDLGVRGGDGIIGAIGPIMRGEIKVHTSQAQIGRDYDILMMGHWHQTLWLPRAHVNNCLKGYDEYARKMLRAPASAPSQSLWFTHPKHHGPTARWEIYVDKLAGQAPRAEAPWVSWHDVERHYVAEMA